MTNTIEFELKKFRGCIENMKDCDMKCEGCYYNIPILRFEAFRKLMVDIERTKK